jgi:hypothetical protein
METGRVPFVGHAHFWERAMARRRFIRTSAGTAALALGTGLGAPLVATADDGERHVVAPRPIPEARILFGGGPFHVFPPFFGSEASTITDFAGLMAAARVRGSGTGTDTQTGATSTLIFDVDLRVMRGTYVGVDNRRHEGTFGLL